VLALSTSVARCVVDERRSIIGRPSRSRRPASRYQRQSSVMRLSRPLRIGFCTSAGVAGHLPPAQKRPNPAPPSKNSAEYRAQYHAANWRTSKMTKTWPRAAQAEAEEKGKQLNRSNREEKSTKHLQPTRTSADKARASRTCNPRSKAVTSKWPIQRQA